LQERIPPGIPGLSAVVVAVWQSHLLQLTHHLQLIRHLLTLHLSIRLRLTLHP
jgi:hypothetical protein